MTTLSPPAPTRITTGALIGRTARLLAAQWRFALLIGGLSGVALTALQLVNAQWWLLRQESTGAAVPGFLEDQNLWAGAGLMWLASLVLTTIAGAWLHRGMLDAVADKPVRIGATLRASLRHAGWYFLALLGIGVATLGGFLLCIVPAFIVLAATAVALPALIAENLGAFGAVDRSLRLTYGHRLVIFFALVLTWLAMTPLSVVAGITAQVVSDPAYWTTVMVANHLISGALWVVPWTLVVVIYHDLRQLTEGYRDDAVAAVFD